MKHLYSFLYVILVVDFLYCLGWCYLLSKNQSILISQLYQYQTEHFRREDELEQQIRVMEQYVKMLEDMVYEGMY